jgi:all-trans-retinol dehydrogenase (NAD+)
MSIIRERVVLITGGAGGIGRLLALELAQLGGRLILWDIDAPGLERTASEIQSRGGEVKTYVCDVSRREEVMRVAELVRKETGEPDVLINNAGIVVGKEFLAYSPEEIERTVGIDLLSNFWTVQAFLPGMLERDRGHIVTISSAAGTIGVAKLSVYCASKFAVFGFHEALRAELHNQRSSVRSTVVCPYYIDTGMFAGVKTRFPMLLPILKETEVTRRIVKAIQKNRKRVVMPWMVYTVPLLRLFPVSWFDTLARFFGINASMEEFRGHPPSRDKNR